MTKFNEISEENITLLVKSFYIKVFKDDILREVFNTFIADFDEHVIKLSSFWSTVLLKSDSYNGNPFSKHLQLMKKDTTVDGEIITNSGRMLPREIQIEHFQRWLELFKQTTEELYEKETAYIFQEKAIQIAKGIGSHMVGERILDIL